VKTCTAFCITLLFLAGPLPSQELQEFNLRDIRPGWSNRGVSLAPYGDGVIALISQDTTWAPVPIPWYVRIGMLAVTLTPKGIIDTMLLQQDGDFCDNPPYGSTSGDYEVRSDASDTTALHVLLETVIRSSGCLTMAYGWRSRLLRVQGSTFTDIFDIGDAYNACVLKTGSGSRWFVWEARTNLFGLLGPDGRYSSTLKACHISPDGSIGDTVVIGSGYKPVLLPDATGDVRLLYCNTMHSRSTDSISLHTALLTMNGRLEDERTLLRDLRWESFGSPYIAAAKSDNSIHILWPGPKTLQHFIFGPDAVLRAGLVAERKEGQEFTLTPMEDRLVALWRSEDSNGICISETGSGQLFERIIHLPNTSGVRGFSLHAGPDGLTKVLFVQGRTIRVFRNPFASAPESVELVAFADSGIVPLSWVFASDGSLWLSTIDRYHFKGAGVYRLASPQLGVQPPRPQSNLLHITGFSPHPVTTDLRVGFSQLRPGNIEYFVFDVLGRLRANGSAGYYHEGEQAAQIQLPALPPGAYVLRLRGEHATAQRQFLVR
jgi:hypothetical protein